MSLLDLFTNLFSRESEKPLGTLTREEASRYFTEYCELMQQGVGFHEKESSLPTTFERMKEALKVECLTWCNSGADFDETCDYMVQGYVTLANFFPDELAEKASLAARRRAIASSDSDALKVCQEASTAARELGERRMNELNVEWIEFLNEYRVKYVA